MSLQRCEGSNLESVLEEVRNRFGDTATIVEANRLRKGGVGGFFARERFEVVVDVDDLSDDTGQPAFTDLPAEYGMEATEGFCDRLLSLADQMSDHDQAAGGPSVSTEHAGFAAVLDSITRHMEAPAAAPAPPPPPAPAPIPAPAPTSAPVATAPAEGWTDARALARLGLPETVVRAAAGSSVPAGADPTTWLVRLLEQLPAAEPLPEGRGAVIVVAGARPEALALARQMAEELGLDSDSLLLASTSYRGRTFPAHLRLDAPETAAAVQRTWRRKKRPTIVVVEAAPGLGGEWARLVIDALVPTMVWGAVEATRKPEDVFDWSERLGGFDALSLTDLDATVSPAALLQCGIPVGLIDGYPATPIQWASVLAPRLAA